MRPSTILAGLSLWFLAGLLVAVPIGKLLRKRRRELELDDFVRKVGGA